jgi:hypothetical protein
MQINTLQDDINATNALRQFRAINGSSQKIANPYNWYQAVFVTLTYMTEGTIYEIADELSIRTGMVTNANGSGRLLKAVAMGVHPDKIRRQYTEALPALVKRLGLKFRKETSKGRYGYRLVYSFKNNFKARQILLTDYPGLIDLFSLLDKSTR